MQESLEEKFVPHTFALRRIPLKLSKTRGGLKKKCVDFFLGQLNLFLNLFVANNLDITFPQSFQAILQNEKSTEKHI